MGEPLRVLIVEDNPDDAALVLRELRRGGREVAHARVETAAAMTAALDAQSWDIVIADYSLPQFSGVAALKLLQERALDLPFILVSGTVGEEIAVAAMKAGAHDYLMKDKLARLGPAVEREMRDAEVRREACRTERQLHRREAQLAEAQRLAHVGSWHRDARTNVLDWSDEMFQICGRDPRQPPPSFEEFLATVHPEDRQRLADILRDPNLDQLANDYRIVRPDGTIRFVHSRGRIVRDASGAPLEVAGMMQDITERKAAEEDLRRARDELEQRVRERTRELSEANASLKQQITERLQAEALLREREDELKRAKEAAEGASRSKSEFLANMSHEIRTPMAAILGYSDLMLDPDQSAGDRLNCVQTIRRNAEHLLVIINDILDLSKIEAGKLQVERIDCSPVQIVSDVASLLRGRAVEKGLALDVSFQTPIPAAVRTDPTRVRQILINLVGNAIKFTENGNVRLEVEMVDNGDEFNPRLRFRITDTGIGMSQQQIERIFRPFEQGDTSTTRRFGGTGLGLTICKRLAAMLGGEISVQSVPGRGSVFCVTVETGPLTGVTMLSKCRESVQTGPEARPTTPTQLTGRILLVDDGPDNRQLLAYFLTQAGADVTVAENGRIGYEKAVEAMKAGAAFDVIVMDMQMPELDGYGATSKLRSEGYSGPIIALTAHAMAEDRTRCIRSGCSDYLSKPVSRRDLLRTVARHLEKGPLEASPAPASPPSVPAATIRSDLTGEPEVQQFLGDFIRHLPQAVGRLCALMRRENLAELREVLHQLKGTGGLYGFPQITDAAEAAQNRVDQEQSLNDIAGQVQALVEIIRRVEGYDGSREGAAPQDERSYS